MNNDKQKEWFIRTWAQGELPMNPECITIIAKQMGIKIENKNFSCVVVRYTNHEEVCANVDLLVNLHMTCKKICKNLPADTYCFIGNRLYVIIVILHDESMAELMRKFLESIRKAGLKSVQIGVGKSYKAIEKLNYSYVEAYEAVSSVSENAEVYYAEDIYSNKTITTQKLWYEKSKVVELFRSGKLGQAQIEVQLLAEKIRRDSPVRDGYPYPTSIRRTFIELIVEIMNIAADAGVNIDTILNHQDPYRHVFECQATPEILNYFSRVMQLLYEGIEAQKEKVERNVLNSVKEIITGNVFNPELSLTFASELLGITPTYLSAFFIREMGVGFNEYITKIRIEHAKEQLLKTNRKICEIALDCGFGSTSYFIVVFRKRTGMSPGAFRNMKEE